MSKLLMGTAALLALSVGALSAGMASAQSYYGPGPRPPYATGAYLGLGFGEPDCSFTIAGAHAGVTVLGVNLGGGARLGIPGAGACQDGGAAPVAYQQQYAPPPPPAYPPAQPYYADQGYQGGGYQGGGYYNQGGYPAPVAYPQPVYGGGYQQPCNCGGPVAYWPY